jgi:hypothetical protein
MIEALRPRTGAFADFEARSCLAGGLLSQSAPVGTLALDLTISSAQVRPMKRLFARLQIIASLFVLTTVAVSRQASADVVYSGSGTSGFGGPIGGSSMTWTDNGSTVAVSFTKGTTDVFNDVFVIYLDTIAGGRSTIGTAVNDRAPGDRHRAGISYMEAGTGKTLTFPTGFAADYAIAITAGGSGFGGLWSIPASGSVGNNGLGFISAVDAFPSPGHPTSITQASFNFAFDLAEIGLAPNSGASIKFAATYLNPYGGDGNLGFASNEGYGGGFGGSNIGQNDFAFTSTLTYVTAVPEASSLVFGAVACSLTVGGFTGRRFAKRGARQAQ